jgi:hypothetical protein
MEEVTKEEFEMLRNLLLMNLRKAEEAKTDEERVRLIRELRETLEKR